MYKKKLQDIRPISEKLNNFMKDPKEFFIEKDAQNSLGLSTFKEKEELLKKEKSQLQSSSPTETNEDQSSSIYHLKKKKRERSPKKNVSLIINIVNSNSRGFVRLPSCQKVNLDITRFEEPQFYSAKLREEKPNLI